MFQFRRFPTYTYEFSICYMDMTPCGFPHSEICGSIAYLQLPAAFRSLSRLSSALSAKASTLRSFLLDYSILVIIALITFVTNFWSVTYYSLKNFTVITMSWSNRYLIILSFCMKFSKYISQQILFSSTDNGDGEIRTLDPLLARQVLSQLSYAPISI